MAGILIPGSAAIAQQPIERRTAAQLQRAEEQCRSAAASQERRAISDVAAFGYYMACGDSGASRLAAHWGGIRDSSAVLAALVESSQRMHDERISDAALAVLQDKRRPTSVRVAALRVVTAHIQPDLLVEFGPIGKTVGHLPGQAATQGAEYALHSNRQATGEFPVRREIPDHRCHPPASTERFAVAAART
jgi:hypothetical protein